MIVSTFNLNQDILRKIELKTGERIAVYAGSGEIPDEVLAEADVVIAKNEAGFGYLSKCDKLELLYIMSAGVDNLPFDELRERGVLVCNASGIHGQQMAEHAIGVMISFSRGLNRSIRNQVNRVWGDRSQLGELAGKTLCIVGAGRIGKQIASAAAAFGMKVVGLKKHAEPIEGFERVYDMSRLHETLGEADYVILLTPLTAETERMIGKPEFEAMKRTAIFLNLSRGETVDEAALVEALRNGTIGGAGLDVFHTEPLPQNSDLWDMDNVVITPHIAGITHNYVEISIEHFIKNLLRYRNGQELISPVNLANCY